MGRLTKVIATLGPSVASPEAVRSLVDAGMDVARLNFSHGDHDLHRSFYEWVRAAASDAGRTVAVMQDIQGPKLRIGDFPDGAIRVGPGSEIDLSPGTGPGDETRVPIGYEALLDDVSPGDRVILADGMVTCEVVDRTSSSLRARVVTGGVLGNNKGVAFPDSRLSVANVTPKDETDLAFGAELGVDFVAASFVRTSRQSQLSPATSPSSPRSSWPRPSTTSTRSSRRPSA